MVFRFKIFTIFLQVQKGQTVLLVPGNIVSMMNLLYISTISRL